MPAELVQIATYPNAAEAEVARAALEGEGIKSYTADDDLVSMVWLLGNAVGYVKLLVAADDAERALAVLREATPSTTVADEENEPTELTDVGDSEARRAWRTAVLGLVVCPPLLSLYSAYLLIKLGSSNPPLSHRGRNSVVGAIVVNLVMLIVLVAIAVGAYYH